MKKTLKLVLLASDKEYKGIYKHSITGKLSLYQDYFSIDKNWYPQNLYTVSDETIFKPNETDYYYDSNYNKITKWIGESISYTSVHFKKVVITTDESLRWSDDNDIQILDTHFAQYPTFTNDFINTYIERYNRNQIIELIEVEYRQDIQKDGIQKLSETEYYSKFPEELPNCVFENVLKVNIDNTVDVSLIEDKLYTKEEVINLIKSRENYLNNSPRNDLYISVEDWIDK